MSKILMVLTSHASLGDTGRATGFHFSEMATPYWAFVDAGHDVTIATIKGGAAVVDPASLKTDPAERPAIVNRFLDTPSAAQALKATPSIADIDPSQFDGVFLPGGHGTMWDMPNNAHLAKAVSQIWAQGGVVGAVCHGPAGIVDAVKPDGRPLVEGIKVNAFTNAEEAEISLTDVMPFLLEERLIALGGHFQSSGMWQSHAVADQRVVTGQNPASASDAAMLFLGEISKAQKPQSQ